MPVNTLDLRERFQPDGYVPVSVEEIFKWVRLVRDPEHPSMSLEDLKVVSRNEIVVDDANNFLQVTFTPTTPSCSMGAVIGLAIKVLLMRILPLRFRIQVLCKPETHDTWMSLNKQINDKERVLAALENPNVMRVIEQSISIEGQIE